MDGFDGSDKGIYVIRLPDFVTPEVFAWAVNQATIKKKYLEQNGYIDDITENSLHHEIYLSDPRKVAPEKQKTVIRHPI